MTRTGYTKHQQEVIDLLREGPILSLNVGRLTSTLHSLERMGMVETFCDARGELCWRLSESPPETERK